MRLLALFGGITVDICRRYWDTQSRWGPRQLVLELLKQVPLQHRVGLLSRIARFDDSYDIRRAALYQLAKDAQSDFPEALGLAVYQGLRDESEYVRTAAVLAAPYLGEGAAVEIASQVLAQDSDGSVQVAATGVLGKCGSVDSIPTLYDAFRRNRINEYVLGRDVKALVDRLGKDVVSREVGQISDSRAREALLKAVG